MTRNLFIVTILITLTLSACGGGGVAQTATPAPTNTQMPTAVIIATTAAPVMTETATPNGTPITATATAGIVGPTNPPNCTNNAVFVADITVPDNTNVEAGTTFTKTWRIANSGTCVWGPDYKLTYYSEEHMGALDVPLGITSPGQNLDISVILTAPNSAGKHQANFVIKNSAGSIVKVGDDSRLWVVINVSIGGTATSTAAAITTPAASTATGKAPAAGTLPAATVPAATTGSSSSDTTACLPAIDRAKLMEVINAVNAYRTQKGLPAYTVNPKLAQAAQRHAIDMACKNVVAHNGSDNSTPQTRVTAAGYTASSVSENVYSNKPPSKGQDVVNGWINDKTDATNNQNLSSTTFTEIGVGYSSLNGSGYYVIVFAKP